MFEAILIAMLIAKIKGYKLKPLFKTWTVYPVFVLELVHLSFQVTIFMGNYDFVQYASILKRVYLFMFLIPIIVYREYLSGLIGSALIFIGSIMNNFVMAQNGGKMPVFPNFSYITGYVSDDALAKIKGIHILGTTQSKWWILSDIIDVGWSVLSIGDLFIHTFALLIIYQTIKVLNMRLRECPILHIDNVSNEQ